LSWVGPVYADKGWIKLTDTEQEAIRKLKVMARVEAEKAAANTALSKPAITVGEKMAWDNYLFALDAVCLRPDFGCDPKFPPRPNA
jgi:hypothetical protein